MSDSLKPDIKQELRCVNLIICTTSQTGSFYLAETQVAPFCKTPTAIAFVSMTLKVRKRRGFFWRSKHYLFFVSATQKTD